MKIYTNSHREINTGSKKIKDLEIRSKRHTEQKYSESESEYEFTTKMAQLVDQNAALKQLEKILTFSGRSNEDVISFIEYIDFVYAHLAKNNQAVATLKIRNEIQGVTINTVRS